MNFILFTGHSCTGKTTISKLLERNDSYSFVSIHSYISKIARERGYGRGRDFFKTEGVHKVSSLVSNYLFKYLQTIDNDKIVIDDIYDFNLLNSIYANFPEATMVLIALKSIDKERLNRMSNRISEDIKTAHKELSLYDKFKKESEIEKVISRANYTVYNDEKTINELYCDIKNILKL